MSVLATETLVETPAFPARRYLQRMPVFRTALMLGLAMFLVVPESEMRAKAFKVNLIVNNMKRHTH